jgi:hypothetical protein
MDKFIECSGGYGSKVFLQPFIGTDAVKLKKIVFKDGSAIPEGYEVHSNTWVDEETLYAVLIDEDQIDEIGMVYDLWEEEVEIGPNTYFKLAIDFNANSAIKEAKEILDQQEFHFKLYYDVA